MVSTFLLSRPHYNSSLTNNVVCAVKPARQVRPWWLLPAAVMGAFVAGGVKGWLQINVSQDHWAIYTWSILDYLVLLALAILPEGTARIVVEIVQGVV